MTAVLAVAFTALLAMSGPGHLLAADAGGAVSGPGAAETEAVPPSDTDPASPEPQGGASQDAPPSGTKTPGVDVNRHRPGACPEGPPCRIED
jgi:hypothetical protein